MRRPPLPRRLGSRPFHVRDARDLGVSRSRLSAGDLVAPFRGVRLPADAELNFLALCEALQTRMLRHQFFSHGTAARIHRMWVPDRLERPDLHVSTLKPGRAPRGDGVRGHQVTMEPGWGLLVTGGLRVLDPVSVWLQLANELSVRELVIMGDALVRRQYPLSTLATIHARVRDNRGHRGQRKLRLALDSIRARTDSPRETELRLEIVDTGFPEPEVNPEIYDSQGRLIGLGDLVYFEHKVVVEYEGDQHRTDSVQFGRDLTRQQELHDEGWTHLRISKHHWPNRRAYLLKHLTPALRAGGWRRGAQAA